MSYLVYESIPEDINQTISNDREMGGGVFLAQERNV